MKGKIFNTQEVQAILNGSKVMFREVIKPQPKNAEYCGKNSLGAFIFHEKEMRDYVELIHSPYQVGQKIFVKETFVYIQDPKACARDGEPCEIHYKADYDAQGLDKQDAESIGVEFKAATLMPQWASRLTLLIKEIKVERLAEISEDDAVKEGAQRTYEWTGCADDLDFTDAFKFSWNATHKKPEKKFEANPWVWVVSFEVINN